MNAVILRKLYTDIKIGGLWGYGIIDYALLMPQKVRQLYAKTGVAGIKISTIWDVDLLQVRSEGWIKKFQLHRLDVVECPAEKAGRLNEDGGVNAYKYP
jgi:hypothetical protein